MSQLKNKISPYPVTWITKNLAIGYAPMSYAEFDAIKTSGIDAIVNLCAEFSDLHELESAAGFEVCYLPIWDEDVPEIDKMENALAWLDEALYLGKKVLVHCRHGVGRTGTFVTSYMIRKGMTLKAASKKLKTSSAKPSNYGQWKLLKKYGKKSGALKIREPSLEIKNSVDLGVFFSEYESLVRQIDKEIEKHPKNSLSPCGCKKHKCCNEKFDIPLIEVLYLHSNLNRKFPSNQRDDLISLAVEKLKGRYPLCPFNKGSGCRIFENRPVRCRVYGVNGFTSDRHEIHGMLFELSQSVFLAFSGRFLADIDFTFSIADTISGKFVQAYFHYMSGLENK